jgi:hypothetical protein
MPNPVMLTARTTASSSERAVGSAGSDPVVGKRWGDAGR